MSAGQVDDELLIAIRAELAPFREAIAKLPQLAGAEGDKIRAALNRAISADKMAGELNKIRNVAERTRASTAGLTGAMERFGVAAKSLQANQLISQLESVGSLGITAGGAVSRLSMMFTTAIRPVATVGTLFGSLDASLQSAILGFGGAAVGLGIAAAALVHTGNAAQETTARVLELADSLEQSAAKGSIKAAETLDTYAEGLDQARAYQALLKHGEAQVTEKILRQSKATAELAAGWANLKGTFTGALSGVGSWLVEHSAVVALLRRDGRIILDQADDYEEFSGVVTQSARAISELVSEVSRLDAGKIQAAFDASKIHAGAGYDVASELRDTMRADLENQKRISEERIRAHQDELAQLARMDWDAAQVARQRAEEAAADADRLRAQELREDQRAAEERKRLAWDVYQEEVRILEDARRAHAEKLQAQADYAFGLVQTSMSSVASLVTQGTQYTIDSYEARRDAGRNFTEEEEAHYKRALHDRRVASITEIVTQAAVAYAGMVAQLAPSLGPAAPALAAISVGAGVIAPLAQLLGESIPWGISGSSDDGQASAPVDLGQAWENAGNGFANPFGPRGGAREDDTSRRARGGATITLDRRTARLRVIQDPPGKAWGPRR